MRAPAERRGTGARPHHGRLPRGAGGQPLGGRAAQVRIVLAAIGAGALVAMLALAGPAPAGAQELCLDGTIVIECPPVTVPTTAAPTTTTPTTAAPTTTTRPDPTTTEAPAPTTQAPPTTESPPDPTTTAPERSSSTVRSSTTRLPATQPTATVVEQVPPTDGTVAPTADASTAPIPSITTASSPAVTTTAAPTTFEAVDKPPTERVASIGASEEILPPPDGGSLGSVQIALALGVGVAVCLVAIVAWRERHRPEAA